MTPNNYPEGLDELVEKVSNTFVKDMENYPAYVSNYGIPQDDVADYTHPAIPGRVALPDGWLKTIGEAARLLQAWIDEEGGCDCEGTHHCGLPALRTCIAELHAMLSATATPPTQPQGDGSLRRGAE